MRVGDHDLTQKYGSPGAQTLRVATTYIHHNHNSQTLDNDIALLKLHGEADLKEGVCLVCIPARGTSQVTQPSQHIIIILLLTTVYRLPERNAQLLVTDTWEKVSNSLPSVLFPLFVKKSINHFLCEN